VHGDDHFPNFHYGIYRPGFQEAGFGAVFSFFNNPYGRYNKFDYDRNTWTKNTWANPQTAVVHMFHADLWGNWMFEVKSINTFREGRLARGSWSYFKTWGPLLCGKRL